MTKRLSKVRGRITGTLFEDIFINLQCAKPLSGQLKSQHR